MNGDDWQCLGCSCTYESGCKLEQRTNEVLKRSGERVRYIPPRRLPVPPAESTYNRDPAKAKAYARERYRHRIETRGGTVRTRD